MKKLLRGLTLLGLAALLLAGCRSSNQAATGDHVVLYCSVDDVYAKPILKKLEEKTGLRIDVLYDTEAAKTAGLANRIRAEKARPRGDIFWSSALLQTLLLQREGLLQPYVPSTGRYVPPQFKDSTGAWTGMGARARVIIYNASVKNPPRTLQDLLQPQWRGKVGISNPQFGSASDWVAALAVRQGKDKAIAYFRALKKNGVQVLPGNSVVADKVARGELLVGVTDTDDFYAQLKKSPQSIRVQNAAPDFSTEDILVPGSIAILKGAPNLKAAQKLVDALLDIDTEDELARLMTGVQATRRAPATDTAFTFHFDSTPDDSSQWADGWKAVREPLADILLRD